MELDQGKNGKNNENDNIQNDSQFLELMINEKIKIDIDDDEKKEQIEVNKKYNDVNYWHIELNENMIDDILKELE